LATFTDRVLLFCFSYDHFEGKYSLAIMTLLKVSGVLTMIAIFGGIAWLLIREKRSSLKNETAPAAHVPGAAS
jgi:protein SCO1/2